MAESAELLRLLAELRADHAATERQRETLVRSLDDPAFAPGAPVLAAAALALHHYYSALESAFERIAISFEGAPTRSDRWHQDLLHQMELDIERVRPAVLRPETTALLRELLQFRHFLRHAYAVEIDAVKLRRVAGDALRVAPLVTADLERFEDVLRAAADGPHRAVAVRGAERSPRGRRAPRPKSGIFEAGGFLMLRTSRRAWTRATRAQRA
jgi:hypothetical protein